MSSGPTRKFTGPAGFMIDSQGAQQRLASSHWAALSPWADLFASSLRCEYLPTKPLVEPPFP